MFPRYNEGAVGPKAEEPGQDGDNLVDALVARVTQGIDPEEAVALAERLYPAAHA